LPPERLETHSAKQAQLSFKNYFGTAKMRQGIAKKLLIIVCSDTLSPVASGSD
jgi:hypothetical protein